MSSVLSPRAQDRCEAATQLNHGSPADLVTSRPILVSLRSDGEAAVSVAATISLLLLGDRNMEADLCARLRLPDNDARALVLDQLARVPEGRLEFARREIEDIATDHRLPLYLTGKAGALLSKLKPK